MVQRGGVGDHRWVISGGQGATGKRPEVLPIIRSFANRHSSVRIFRLASRLRNSKSAGPFHMLKSVHLAAKWIACEIFHKLRLHPSNQNRTFRSNRFSRRMQIADFHKSRSSDNL
jgi:hypothetical protein